MGSDGRKRWVSTLVLGISAIVTIGLAEVGARVWIERFADDAAFRRFASLAQLRTRMRAAGQSVSRYAPHRFVGYVPAPNFRQRKNRHGPLGYRGDPIPQPKPDGEFRIVCLGGSTTYGARVPDPSLAYPAQLERWLHASGHPEVRVVNAGAEGWASWESLANFQFRVLDLDPDLIIVYHAVNDLAGRMVWPPTAYRGDQSGSVRHSPGLWRPVPLIEQSTMARILLVASGRTPSQVALIGNFTRLAPTGYYFAFQSQMADGSYPSGPLAKVTIQEMLDRNPPRYFRRNLENIIATARIHDVQPVMATFAMCDCIQKEPALVSDEVLTGIDEHNLLIQEIGREMDVPVFDFSRVFPRDERLFSSAAHLTVQGNRLRGKLFAEYLLEEGLIPPRS